jgi:ribosomal protein S18 acetylase RimI-like enzyme
MPLEARGASWAQSNHEAALKVPSVADVGGRGAPRWVVDSIDLRQLLRSRQAGHNTTIGVVARARQQDNWIVLRTHPASSSDLGFMWSMLFYAAHANEQPEATVASIQLDPELQRYVSDWGRPGDFGLVATDNETPVGAAWLRLFTSSETHLVTYVASEIPELVIAVGPEQIGLGIGSLLLDNLLTEADRSAVPAIVLTARADNPAVRLYQRYGFAETDRIANRIGTESVKMVRKRSQ